MVGQRYQSKDRAGRTRESIMLRCSPPNHEKRPPLLPSGLTLTPAIALRSSRPPWTDETRTVSPPWIRLEEVNSLHREKARCRAVVS